MKSSVMEGNSEPSGQASRNARDCRNRTSRVGWVYGAGSVASRVHVHGRRDCLLDHQSRPTNGVIVRTPVRGERPHHRSDAVASNLCSLAPLVHENLPVQCVRAGVQARSLARQGWRPEPPAVRANCRCGDGRGERSRPTDQGVASEGPKRRGETRRPPPPETVTRTDPEPPAQPGPFIPVRPTTRR